MNTRHGTEKFKNSQVLLYSGFSSTIVMGRIIEKLHSEKYAVMQWLTRAGNITTNNKVKVYFTLPVISATHIVTWKCHVDDSAQGSYYTILGKYLLTELVLN